MQQQRQQAIIVFARGIEERVDDHPEMKHEKVTEQDGQRMAHEQVLEADAGGGFLILFLGHDGI